VRRPGLIVAALVALGLLPAAAAAQQSARAVVSVRTAPATPGLVLTFAGHRYVTDSAGRAAIPRAPGVQSVDVQNRIEVGSRQVDPNTIVRFSRWFPVGNDSVAALDVFRRVAWSFADTSNAAIPATRVERLVLRSTSGEVKDIQRDLGRPRWLFARRVSLVRGRIVVKNIDYALQRVTVLGSDVVHAGQQSFTPAKQRSVTFTLGFYTLTIRGEDALFGSSVSGRARLELPNGSVRMLSLVNGQATLASLPRGNYSITLKGGAYSFSQPLVLSRAQVAVVPLVTYLDVLVVGGGLLVVAIGLVLVGRPYLARRAAARLGSGGRGPGGKAE
jgi:hypothetical protein